MNQEQQRPSVLWLGETPAEDLAIAIDLAGAELVVASPDEIDPNRLTACVVLLPVFEKYPGKFRGPTTRFLVPSMDAGATFVLVVMDEDQRVEAANYAMQLVKDKAPDAKALHELYPDFRVEPFVPREIGRIVRTAQPGPCANHNLAIAGLTIDDDKLRQSTEILFKRAFADFDRIVVTPLDGGRSGGSVWKVHGYRGSECCEPFVAKIAKRQTLEDEYKTWSGQVLDFVPFPFRAPPVEERFVRGARLGLLVSRLASRCQRLDEYVGVVKSNELAMVSLFHGALRNWRRNTLPKHDRLGHLLALAAERVETGALGDQSRGTVRKSILPERARLQDAFRIARAKNTSILSPDEMLKILHALPPIRYRECKAHGDLNARNIFVRWNGVDVILIDFSHAGDHAPLARDPSRLDVSLAFDVAIVSQETAYVDDHLRRSYAGRMLPDHVLDALYSPPLLRTQWWPPEEDGRTDAIRHIRLQVIGEGVTADEYEIVTACHLLNFTRPGPKTADELGTAEESNRLRGLAYSFASRILEDLQRRLLDVSEGPKY